MLRQGFSDLAQNPGPSHPTVVSMENKKDVSISSDQELILGAEPSGLNCFYPASH